jgi:hypothetical protein
VAGLVDGCDGYICGCLLVIALTNFKAGTDANRSTVVLRSPGRLLRYAVQTIAPADGTVSVRTNTAGAVYGTVAVPLHRAAG